MTKIFLAGHHGMVGRALLRKLKERCGEYALITRDRSQLDLTNQTLVREFMQAERPDAVILAAAKVGGIHANNTYPADFIYQNLMIECNVIHQAFEAGVKKLLLLGSSCIYPKMATQPIVEQELLTGALEATNEPYAIAKIAGIKLCESYNRQYGTDYRSVMPTNLYGPWDSFHPENSHVLPALIARFHEAKTTGLSDVVIWGTGEARREFLHVDDMASATIFIFELTAQKYSTATDPMRSHINIGSGTDISISELARTVAKVTGFTGRILTDPSKPDGAPRKLMNVGLMRSLGWHAEISLEDGIRQTYGWYVSNRRLRGG